MILLCAGFFLSGMLAGWLLRRFFYPRNAWFVPLLASRRKHSFRRRRSLRSLRLRSEYYGAFRGFTDFG